MERNSFRVKGYVCPPQLTGSPVKVCINCVRCSVWPSVLGLVLAHYLVFSLFLDKTPRSYYHRVHRPASVSLLSSFVTTWGSRISGERFEVESPNFMWAFTPVGSTITLDMTSLYISGRKLTTFEKGWEWRLRWLQPRITKIGTNIHTDIMINHAGYDVTSYFRSEDTAKKSSKMPPETRRFKWG